jgi:hypothetical protein
MIHIHGDLLGVGYQILCGVHGDSLPGTYECSYSVVSSDGYSIFEFVPQPLQVVWYKRDRPRLWALSTIRDAFSTWYSLSKARTDSSRSSESNFLGGAL